MPRRAEYRPAVQPTRKPKAPNRIGPRHLTCKSNRKDVTITLDPANYGCSALVAELADEWVSYLSLSNGAAGLAYHYRKSITEFAVYADEHCVSPASLSLANDHPDVAHLASEWWRTIPTGHLAGSVIPAMRARALRGLMKFRAQREDVVVSEGVLRLISAPHGVRAGKSTELDEFSRSEKRALIRAAWDGIRQVEDRLAKGQAMIASAGGHPDQHGWLDAGNLLWALARGELSVADIVAGLPRLSLWPVELSEFASMRTPLRPINFRHQLVAVLVSMLYPRDADLYGFQVLLMDATGRAPEEVSGLDEADVEFTPSGVRLTMTKSRAHLVRHQVFGNCNTENAAVSGRDVAEVVHRLLTVTDRARQDCALEPKPLFLRAAARDQGRVLGITRLGETGARETFTWWTKFHGLDLSAPVDLRRIRKSGKVEKVIATRGVVSDIADDHTVETFKGHYAHGTTVHVISGHVVNQAQRSWFDAAVNGPITLDGAAVEELEDSPALDALGITSDQAGQIIAGELDMGVTSCRDPYDSPYSKQGDLCAVAPLRCLECQNAFVLPSNLPQLLMFSDHLQQLKLRLSPPHFHTVWGQSLTNLHTVLVERTAVEINAARSQIRDETLSLQLPLAARTEFDL